MENFSVFSTKDRQDISYAACIGGTTISGMAIGRFGMLPGVVAGAMAGLALGMLTCKKLSPAIEKKLFSGTEPLSESELLSVLRVIRDQTGVQTKSEAMYLLSQARVAAAASGEKLRASQNVCVPPRVAAHQLLSRRV